MEIELLKELCRIPGAPGFESKIRKFILDEISHLVDEISTDALGNIIAIKKGISTKKLLFTAHMDEIGFIVQHIDDEGFIRFLPLGGFDPKTLSSQRVLIHGVKDILGVMGTKPIHLMSLEERNKCPQIKDYFIDTGLPKAELEKSIQIGDPITRERDLVQMGRCINAKSLDNRISVYTLIQIIKRLNNVQTDITVHFAFTVQEEVGLRGAKTLSTQINPDFAINIDTTIAYDVPGSQAHEAVTKLGSGVGIKIMDSSVVSDYRMVQFLKNLAEKNNINWQPELLPAGGTDTSAIQTSGNGCIVGALSIPTRHIHQVIEMIHMDDVTDAIELSIASIQNIIHHDWSH